jgi:copper oxidase (laccase) domain-containing protein
VLTEDDPGNVVENRRRLSAALGVEPERVAMGWQVHGADLAEWDAPPSDPGYARPGAGLQRVDGHVTSVPGLGLLVLAADCYPLALSDGATVAMVHCGWRGLAAGIVGSAVERLSGPVSAAVGPGVGACCYEVGPEVLAAATTASPAARAA